LANSGKNDFLRFSARFQHPLQFSAGNDIETTPQAGKQVEYRQIRVGLDRVAYEMIALPERNVEGVIGRDQGRARINIAGRTEFAGDTIEFNRFDAQSGIAIAEEWEAAQFILLTQGLIRLIRLIRPDR